MRRLLVPLVLLAFACGLVSADDPVPAGKKPLPLPIDAKHADQWRFSDPAVWKFSTDDTGKGVLELAYDRKAYKSPYAPKHRSPIHIALFKAHSLTDFVMDIEVMSTTELYGHQDACLFFGFQDPTHFYYVHLAPAPDANAHNIFIVNDAPRKNLLEPQKTGIAWKKNTWHKLRLLRQGSTGKIEVYFDDFTKPVLAVEDKTFTQGYVGFGSFDDTARFRNAILYTANTTPGKPADFFKPLGK